MSYKTNPITNRFNINKGWMNANFPENLAFYARDNVFFFKLYLFLKTYFTLRNLKLISCQIRMGQDHVPVLYLIINTTTRRKKKRSTSTFRHLWPTKRAGFKYSPLRNPWNAEALTLMFFDLAKLKKIFQAQLLPLSKQKPSRFWLTKPRLKTWLNFLDKVRKCRTQNIRWRHIKAFNPNRVKVLKSNLQSALEFKLSRAMKEFLLFSKILKILTSQQNVTPQTLIFYKQRLKTISKSIKSIHYVLSQMQQRRQSNLDLCRKSTLTRSDSSTRFFENQKKRKLNWSFNNVKPYQTARTQKLIFQFQRQQFKFFHQILKKSQFYQNHWDSIKIPIRKKNQIFRKFWSQRLKKKRRKFRKLKLAKRWTMAGLARNHVIKHWKQKKSYEFPAKSKNKKHWKSRTQNIRFKPPLWLAQRQRFITIAGLEQNRSNPVKKLLLHLLTIRLKMDSTWPIKLFPQFFQKNLMLQRKLKHKFFPRHLSRKSLRNQLINHLLKKKPRLKAKKTKKTVMPLLLQQFQQLRQKKKIQWNSLDRTAMSAEIMTNYRLKSHSDIHKKRKIFQRLKFEQRVTTDPVSPNHTRTYRQSFRMSYKNHLNLLVRYQYKLWLQKVLHLFFQTRFEVKFTQPLAQFKNLKFLRLVYPIRNFSSQNTKAISSSKQNLAAVEEKFLGKRYVYLGTRLKRLKTFKKNIALPSKVSKIEKQKKRKIEKEKILSKKQMSSRSKKQRSKTLTRSGQNNLNTYPFQKKDDIFKRNRRKKLRDYAQKRLGLIKNQLLMRELVPTLSLFVKYLNPQILADHIAKEFEKTKKHRKILFALKTALRSLKFARGIGYRIAIVGRINSSTKSRAFYLTKRNLIRQNFSKKINYATAQAKARIGSFGIKVWLFY